MELQLLCRGLFWGSRGNKVLTGLSGFWKELYAAAVGFKWGNKTSCWVTANILPRWVSVW